MQLIINWDDETEYLDIDPDCRDRNRITETRSWWPELGDYVYYQVGCTVHKLDGGCRLDVRYEECRQTDENIVNETKGNGQSFWGVNRIIVNHGPQEKEVSCTWIPDDGKVCEGWPPVKIVGRRLRITREQWARESRFRKAVLAEDKKCVISGEVTPEVLDAAHLRPVKEGGEELVENGLILRTDIHRLYDRGLFLINPKDGTIVIGKNLSKSYKKLLRKPLPQVTLVRVRKALQENWRNPWP